jgi:hypothetical protein
MEVPEDDKHLPTQQRQTSSEVQPNDKSGIRNKSAWLIILGVALAIIAIVAIIVMRSGSGSETEGSGSISQTSSDHSPGSEVILYIEGRDSVMAAVDEGTLDELISALSTRGSEAQDLIQSGRVITVPNKTRVRIVEAGFAKLKVRIIEGDKIMHEVWVPERWVR